MNATMLRGSAFASSSRVAAVRPAISSRASTVVVRAVQDLQGKVVSKGMQQSVVVAVERLSAHDKLDDELRSLPPYRGFQHVHMAAVVGTTQQQQAFEAFAAWRCVATKHASYVQLQHQTGSSPVLEACMSASKVAQVCFGS
ncbi:hypothetical protein OEZ85_011771 [Tetradesmus obliquus]|uniref:Uncharacterized protein n=1 Tax=Tetradesmus obliquus TaxID=3088 RepID=A0ABY8TTN5_TETOB|nr:hypothetical protein OEZ85_011771 [Tetradesmus obliquus]